MNMDWTRLQRQRVRPTRRAWLHLLLGGLLYAAGSNVGAGWVVALAGAVIGVVPWGFLSVRRAAARLEVRREVPPGATAGVAVPVALSVRAPTAASVVVRDDLTGAVGTAEDPRAGATLAGATALRRGLVTGGTVQAVVTDLFGLIRATTSAVVPSPVEVLPPVPRLRAVDRLADRGGEEGAVPLGSGGVEVRGVREYVPGDPLRAVHWRSTARHGRVVVREFDAPRRPRLRIRLDEGDWSRAALDAACAAAAGVASAAASAQQQVDVAADGTVLSWGRAALHQLATLPPHAGADPRPLAPSPSGGEVELVLAPAVPAGVQVQLRGAAGDEALGVLPDDGDADLAGWLSQRLAP